MKKILSFITCGKVKYGNEEENEEKEEELGVPITCYNIDIREIILQRQMLVMKENIKNN